VSYVRNGRAYGAMARAKGRAKGRARPRTIARSPLGAVGSVLTGVRATSVTTTASQGGTGIPPQDECTYDGLLVYSPSAGGTNGPDFRWHVKGQGDACVTKLPTSTETAGYIYSTQQRIYVGPFPVDLKNEAGQITTIASPGAIASGWGDWLASALTSIGDAYVKAGAKGTGGMQNQTWRTAWEPFRIRAWFGSTRLYQAKAHMFSMLPRVVGATQDYYDAGVPGSGPSSGVPFTTSEQAIANGCTDPTIAKNQLLNVYALTKPYCNAPGSALTFPAVARAYASGGHDLHPSKAWFDDDGQGHRITIVQYADDPNTYRYYNFAQWLGAISPRLLDGLWALLPFTYLQPGNTVDYNRSKNLPPLARFKWPRLDPNQVLTVPNGGMNGGTYTIPLGPTFDAGLWLSLGPTSGGVNANPVPEGDWDTSLDGPSSHVLQIAMGPMPQPGFWDTIEDALLWIPSTIAGITTPVLDQLASWAQQFACDVAGGQAAINAVKDPETKLQMQAALLAAQQLCPTGPPNCMLTPSDPRCMMPKPALKPWWQSPLVLLGGLGVAAAVMLATRRTS
jgi:hypothetical protein